jgi:hypothetical protein
MLLMYQVFELERETVSSTEAKDLKFKPKIVLEPNKLGFLAMQ